MNDIVLDPSPPRRPAPLRLSPLALQMWVRTRCGAAMVAVANGQARVVRKQAQATQTDYKHQSKAKALRAEYEPN